jgi:hypothetical protein
LGEKRRRKDNPRAKRSEMFLHQENYFTILDGYAASQLICSACTFCSDYFLPFVAPIREFLQRRVSYNIQYNIGPHV